MTSNTVSSIEFPTTIDVLLTPLILGRVISTNDEASSLGERRSGVEGVSVGGCDDIHDRGAVVCQNDLHGRIVR